MRILPLRKSLGSARNLLQRRSRPRRYQLHLECLEPRTVPTWIGATTGLTNDAAHNYNNPANWAGGVIDDSFAGVTFTTHTNLYFTGNRTTGATGLNLNYNGNVDLTLLSSSSTVRTLTLAGPVAGDFGGAANSRIVSLGLPTNPLNIDMGGGTGVFNVAGSGDTLKVYNVISNGSLTKTGPGELDLIGNNTYGGATNIQGGTVKLGDVAVPAGFGANYSFDSVSGTTVNNGGSLGAAKNGTLMGGASVGAGGLHGNALKITSNASGDFMGINLTGGKGVDLSGGQWTASSWFNNLFAPGSWRTLFRANSGDNDHQVIVLAGSTTLGMYNNGGGGPGGFNALNPNYDVVTGGSGVGGISSGWHQLTVVGYDAPAVASPGFENFYIDGQFVGTTAAGSNSDIYAVGNYQGGGQAFASLLDDVYIYQSALSPSQVFDLYSTTQATPPAPGPSNFIPDTSAVTIAAGATLNVNGFTETIQSLANSGTVLLNGGKLIVLVSGPKAFYAVGNDAGNAPAVRVYDAATHALLFDFLAYDPSVTGGVRVAVGDVNNDGVPDIITVPGPGGYGPLVRVFSGQDLSLLAAFNAYDPGFSSGVFVAAGDLNNDGFADIVTGPDAGGGSLVRGFSGKDLSLIFAVDAYPGFTGGVHVAVGNTTGVKGQANIITGPGTGGGSQINVFDGRTEVLVLSFDAYVLNVNGILTSFANGAWVAAGDTNGDGIDEIITGPGLGGGPLVKVFNSTTKAQLAAFNGASVLPTGGVRVASIKDLNQNQAQEIVTDAAPNALVPGGGGISAQAYDGVTLALLDSLFLFDPTLTGACFIAGSH